MLLWFFSYFPPLATLKYTSIFFSEQTRLAAQTKHGDYFENTMCDDTVHVSDLRFCFIVFLYFWLTCLTNWCKTDGKLCLWSYECGSMHVHLSLGRTKVDFLCFPLHWVFVKQFPNSAISGELFHNWVLWSGSLSTGKVHPLIMNCWHGVVISPQKDSPRLQTNTVLKNIENHLGLHPKIYKSKS